MGDEDIIDQAMQVGPYRWKPLELFHTIYPDDEEFNNLDPLFPGRIGYVYKNDDGSIAKIVIAKVWPHDFGKGDDDETALYGPNDQ